MQFMRTDPALYAAFYAALEAQGPDRIETYYDRHTDCIDGDGSEIIKALIEAGWTAPIEHHVTTREMTREDYAEQRLTPRGNTAWLAACTCGASMAPLYPGEANAWEQGHLGTRPTIPVRSG